MVGHTAFGSENTKVVELFGRGINYGNACLSIRSVLYESTIEVVNYASRVDAHNYELTEI